MESAIKITAKLYRCRDAAKSFAKMTDEDYIDMLKPYTIIIKQVMQSNNIKAISALLKISESNTYQDSTIAQLFFMAAIVELMEPSVI